MELQSVHEIFTNKILRIPSYQRGYTWSNSKVIETAEDYSKVKGQLKDLWEDLMNIPNDSWHYIGLLTLDEADKEYDWLRNHSQFSIVDGQQRITTIIILLSVIIQKAKQLKVQLDDRPGDEIYKYLFYEKGTEIATIFGYDKDNPSKKFFRKFILKLDDVEDENKETTYTENLKNAKTFFELMVVDLIKNNPVELQKLYVKITTNLRFNQYILPEELDAFVVFETMNNRGKPLSELEKLKNRLMYLNSKSSLFKISEKESDEELKTKLLHAQKESLEKIINQSWITIYASLGANKSNPLDDEDFLRNHWIAYFGKYDRSKKVPYSKFLFDEHFTLSNLYNEYINYKTIDDYVKSLQRASIAWNKIHNIDFFFPEEFKFKNTIQSLYRVGLRPPFRPLILAILLREDKNDFIEVIKLLEDYSFKIFHVADKKSNTGDSKLYRLAYQIYQNKRSVADTLNDINGYIKEYYGFSLFQNQVNELFDYGKKQGFYNWTGRFYFLFEFDNSLREDNKTSTVASVINWKDFANKKTIEHIFPQSAALSLEEYAKTTIDKITEKQKTDFQKIQNDWQPFSKFNPDERKRFCNSLGNLLALTRSDNSSFSNDPFLFKVDQSNKGEDYKNRGYRYDSMSAQLVAKESDWTPETIVSRGMDMLDFLWNKLHPNKENEMTKKDKLNLLGLGFLIKEEVPQHG